ncbi:MAG: hypothetical protein ACREHD_07010 [Pirellulales bacterium]
MSNEFIEGLFVDAAGTVPVPPGVKQERQLVAAERRIYERDAGRKIHIEPRPCGARHAPEKRDGAGVKIDPKNKMVKRIHPQNPPHLACGDVALHCVLEATNVVESGQASGANPPFRREV